jgi:2'-5' RNA ligase
MAAYLDEDDQKPFQEIIARVTRTRHSFRDTLNLHHTLLSLGKIVEENSSMTWGLSSILIVTC